MAEKQFGPYRLVHQIALGGMAEIHLAKTRGIAGFEKFVALKMIHPNFSQDQQFIEMLIDEAKLTVQLQHVNIAQTFDLGRVDETYYITMEYVDGADLYKLLRKGSEIETDTPVEVAAFIAKEVANGLDYAHRKRDHMGKSLGIVHRDVSPQNVLISYSGEVKLVDFGIAKATMRARQTAVGVIKGKYYYMSPEQAWGEPLDHRTDIFSAGILLYEMLTGQMLYLEEDLHKLLDMIRRADIAPPSTLREGIPLQLEKIVMRALRGDREERYPSSSDLASDLERFLHAHSPVFTPTKVVRWMDSILGERQPAAPAPEPEPEPPIDRRRQTQRISRDLLFLDASELTDENSIIFDVSELDRAREAMQRRGPAAEPPELDDDLDDDLDEGQATVERAKPVPMRNRAPGDVTRQLEPSDLSSFDIEDVQERTVISGPPTMDGAPQSVAANGAAAGRRLAAARAAREHGPVGFDAEATAIGGREFDALQGEPTVPFEDGTAPGPAPALSTAEGPEDPLAGFDAEATEIESQPPTRPGRPMATVGGASGWEAVPALAAANPKPAVSAIRQPRASRRTPPEGVAAPSALSELLSGERAPGRIPRVAISSPAPDPLAGQDRNRAAVAGSAGRRQAPDPVAGVRPRQPRPGENLGRLAERQPIAPPPAAAGSAPFPGLPAPDPSMMNTSAQFAAAELDEIPARYKVGRRSNRGLWIAVAGVGVALAAIAIVATVLGGDGTRAAAGTHARLDIVSTPPGATVYIDGERLEGTTPAVFRDAVRGQAYLVALELDGHQRWESTERVPEEDERLVVTATLIPRTVSLKVESEPPDAEVIVNGKPMGRTPLSLPTLDPGAATELVIQKRGFLPIKRRLDWSIETDQSHRFELKK
jgi:serine/threonine protein kinase